MNHERTRKDKTDAADLQVIAQARRLTQQYSTTDTTATQTRTRILTELFHAIGENVAVDIPFHCDYGKHITVGSNVIININCTFIDTDKITIGDNVLIASNVQLYTATHTPEPSDRILPNFKENRTAWFRTYTAPIIIENGVWIGGGAIVLPGVTIGENSVIGAGSVVTRSIPANCVAVGNPCRPIRFFEP